MTGIQWIEAKVTAQCFVMGTVFPATAKNYPAQNVSSAEVEKLLSKKILGVSLLFFGKYSRIIKIER